MLAASASFCNQAGTKSEKHSRLNQSLVLQVPQLKKAAPLPSNFHLQSALKIQISSALYWLPDYHNAEKHPLVLR